MRRKSMTVLLALGTAAMLSLSACSGGAAPTSSDNTLIVGMTASDIPNLDTQKSQDQGYEGMRFVGFQLYDALTRFDLSSADERVSIIPSLAESWEESEDRLSWTFHLRPDVTFHDGTPFNADAVVFAFDRMLDPELPEYDPLLTALAGTSLVGVASYEATDEHTFVIHTNGPWATLADDMAMIYIPSPTAVREEGKEGFSANPVGTGPFKFESVTRGQELVLTANEDYWNGAPKLDRLILKPIPDVAARTAALQAGEVNWIEAPNPDDIDLLEQQGLVITQNSYPHSWPWVLNAASGPLADVRVRQAMEYAIDRQTMVDGLLAGTAEPSYQMAPSSIAAFTPDNDVWSYDPDRARELLAEAGYTDGVDITVSVPTGGSGNMRPIQMNEQLRADLAAVGIRVTLQQLEWATLQAQFLGGQGFPEGVDAVNISLPFITDLAWPFFFGTDGPVNQGGYSDPELDEMLAALPATVDPTERTALLQKIAGQVDKGAPWLNVVNDLNPRAMTTSVSGFVTPKSWFIDLTTVSVD